MSIEVGLVLFLLFGLLAYIVRGITGAASAIVFNALFGIALALGLTGSLTLLDGLYWVALADMVSSVVLLVLLRSELRLEPFILRLLAFFIPVAFVFTLLLPVIDVGLLAVGLGLVLMASGVYLAVRRSMSRWDEATLTRRATPAGLAAGVLSGLYGMGGPIILVYLAHAGPETAPFRMRAALITSSVGIVRGTTVIVSGAVGAEGLIRFGLTVPVILAGLGIGMWLHPKVGPRAFRLGLGLIVIVAGVLLVARSLAISLG